MDEDSTLERSNAANEIKFRKIYESNYNNLCRAAYRILHEKETAREVVQDVFVTLWNKNTWHELKSPEAYLYVSVYHQCIKIVSRRKLFVSDDSLVGHINPSELTLENKELEKIIADGINNLPDRCKAIFILSREAEMSYDQIAKHLGLSIKTVDNQMGIALKKLREHLAKWWK
jgi:RNA polymerase sigma-70 factor, ECF subfamily